MEEIIASHHEEKELESIHSHASDNEIEIVSSKQCGCFFCRQIYNAREVQDWINDARGTSAICPICGIDAVIGDASGIEIEKPLLKEMNLKYFPKDVIKNDPQAALTYCQRYLAGEISHKPTNEKLYVSYLTSLADEGDPKATLQLAEFYEGGAEFAKPNIDLALQYYTSKCLKDDPRALIKVGNIHYMNSILPEEARAAYECFAKAAALGDLPAVYCLADCYQNGVFVKKDLEFAYKLLSTAFAEVDSRFRVDRRDWFDYPEFAYRLGECFKEGKGTFQDDAIAITFFLMAELSYNLREVVGEGITNPLLAADIFSEIKAYAKSHNVKRGEPILDSDTFYDSFKDGNNANDVKSFQLVSFDKESSDVTFDVDYPSPQTVVDIASLYAGFVNGKVRWTFHEVASVKVSPSSREFNEVRFDEENETWSLVRTSADGDDDVIAEFRFAIKEHK